MSETEKDYHIKYQWSSNSMIIFCRLRGDRQVLEGIGVLEGAVRYRHQGGGQEQADHIRVNYNKTMREKKNKKQLL